MNPKEFLPRHDLREPAFRRYETYIARACRESYEQDPSELGVTAHTFACRFRDAILGMIRYGYDSSIIPKDFDFRDIKTHETINGTVYIQNSKADSHYARQQQVRSTDDEIVATMQKVAREKSGDIVFVAYGTPEDREHILSIVRAHPEIDCHVRDHNGKLNFYTI